MTASKIVIAGAMGAGKTTVGRALAARLGWPLADSDDDIERLTGRNGAAIAAEDGVEALHALEAEVLQQALQAPGPAVIDAAGSTVESSRCREALREVFVVWLDPPEDVLTERRQSGSHRRPIDETEARRLARRRRGWLEEVADLRIEAPLSPDEAVGRVMAALGK